MRTSPAHCPILQSTVGEVDGELDGELDGAVVGDAEGEVVGEVVGEVFDQLSCLVKLNAYQWKITVEVDGVAAGLVGHERQSECGRA